MKLITFTSLSSYDGKECAKKRDGRVKLLFFFFDVLVSIAVVIAKVL